MPPQTPLLLVDNFLETITGYTGATLTSSSADVGHEVFRVADGRRELTWWQPTSAAANHGIAVDLGVGVSIAADFVWLDRGHNLWGKTLVLQSGTDGVTFPTVVFTRAVPAIGTVGGDPTTTWAVTEEGALYTLFTGAAAKRGWNLVVTDNMIPVITGAMIGKRIQLLGYASGRDEDAGERTQRSETSEAGYRATGKPYTWRPLSLPLRFIGVTEYDAVIRSLRHRLFDRQQPVFLVFDYGVRPERGWLCEYDGARWSAPMTRVYRDLTIPLREVGALVS